MDAKGTPRVLLGLTGSVASVKAPILVKSLSEFAEVQVHSSTSRSCRVRELQVIASEASLTFFEEGDLPEGTRVWRDSDEADFYDKEARRVLHIELRRWADLFLIAPLSANTLAKMVYGLCDNVVTETVRCWDYDEKPLLVAPAMNTLMWTNPPTAEQIEIIEKRKIHVIQPIAKVLACGDNGLGGMAETPDVTKIVHETLKQRGLI